MFIIRSKVTSQGQISIPAQVRKKLGVGPGSVLEWDDEGDKIVVRRFGKYSTQDIHDALFPDKAPRTRTLPNLKEGIKRRLREKHARG